MDARTDDGRKVITIAHPEHSSGELKIPVAWYFTVSVTVTQEVCTVIASIYIVGVMLRNNKKNICNLVLQSKYHCSQRDMYNFHLHCQSHIENCQVKLSATGHFTISTTVPQEICRVAHSIYIARAMLRTDKVKYLLPCTSQ